MSIAAGEQLTERQALQALLLPSANNIAAVLARWDAGSADRFVARMNATARSLGMTHTRYTDPSGYDDATVSTAADQVRIVDRAMRLPVFASIVATPSATLPVAGTVHNTNTLLGHNGFVGVKTGSTAAAGGCFAFRAIRWIDGKRTTITGVVLGQPGDDRVAAGLAAADAMVDRIAGQGAVPDSPQPTPAPGTPPRMAPGTLPRMHARQRTGADAISNAGRNHNSHRVRVGSGRGHDGERVTCLTRQCYRRASSTEIRVLPEHVPGPKTARPGLLSARSHRGLDQFLPIPFVEVGDYASITGGDMAEAPGSTTLEDEGSSRRVAEGAHPSPAASPNGERACRFDGDAAQHLRVLIANCEARSARAARPGRDWARA